MRSLAFSLLAIAGWVFNYDNTYIPAVFIAIGLTGLVFTKGESR